jgi:predicted O-methyltransferase YrrM
VAETPAHLKTPEELASRPAGGWEQPEPKVDRPRAECSRHAFLAQLHELLAPHTYLEIGVNVGKSLALSRTRSIGVDPAFRVEVELHCDLQLVREGSDEFFARPGALEHFQGVPIDLAFIDGMHLSEFALRDFMNLEKLMSPTGVILIDDVMPRNALEAARDRRTAVWTGDVYKVVEILREQRPDLTIIPVNTSATGTALVLGMDPTSTVLQENYEANLEVCRAGDPQSVPDEVLHRKNAVAVSTLTASPLWARLVALRESGDRAEVAALLAELPGR